MQNIPRNLCDYKNSFLLYKHTSRKNLVFKLQNKLSNSKTYVNCLCSCVCVSDAWLCDPMDCSCQALCAWNFPGKSTRVGCHFLLQGLFPCQGSNPCLLHLLYWQVDSLPQVVCMHAQTFQLCPTLCNPIDCSPPGSSILGILQARILEWVSLPSSRGSSWPRNWTHISCVAGRLFTHWANWESHLSLVYLLQILLICKCSSFLI